MEHLNRLKLILVNSDLITLISRRLSSSLENKANGFVCLFCIIRYFKLLLYHISFRLDPIIVQYIVQDKYTNLCNILIINLVHTIILLASLLLINLSKNLNRIGIPV